MFSTYPKNKIYSIMMNFKKPEKQSFRKHWGKEKMLVTRIFSFFKNVFYPHKNKFQRLSHICFIKCFRFCTTLKVCHVVKQHFLLFPKCFYPPQNKFQQLSHICFVICKCFQFCTTQKSCHNIFWLKT